MNKINWKEYNNKLVQQGQVTFWFSEDVVENWTCERSVGGSYTNHYSDLAIEVLLTIKFFYQLTYRSTQGFAESIIDLMGFNIETPDYTTLCRRLKKLSIDLNRLEKKGNMHIVVDSTGLKVYGEGEWKVRAHGYSKRRDWRKLHLVVDEENNQIIAVELTGNDEADCEVLPRLLDSLSQEEVTAVSADGAYDTFECYDAIEGIGAQANIPPRAGAKIRQHGNSKKPPLPRDENIRKIRETSLREWKKDSGYHRRSISETAMYRFKACFSHQMSSKMFGSQFNEAMIKVKILNRLATPRSL